MGRASQEFDRQLFSMKMSELSHQMQIKSVASDKVAFQGASGPARLGGSALVRIVDGQLVLLREWLGGVDRIAREVWQTQGVTITPDFVRYVLVPEAMMLIGTRESAVKSDVASRAVRTHVEDPYPAQHRLAMEISKLKGEVANRYEIEARELEYQKAPAEQGSPQCQLDEQGSIRGLIEDATKDTALWLQSDPLAEERAHVLALQERLTDLDRIIARRVERRSSPKDAWQWSETACEVRSLLYKAREMRGNIVGKGLARLADHLPQELLGSKRPHRLPAPLRPVSNALTVTQAPAPPTSVGGHGLTPYSPTATEVPANPPMYFLSDLWPQTNVILLEARKKFPLQTETRELCRHVIAEMTPFFCAAVKAGKMKASAVQRECGGGMEDLLHSLLVCNDDGPKSGFSSLSHQAYQRGQQVRKSDEWLALAKAIAEAQHNGTAADIQQSESGKQNVPTSQPADQNVRDAILKKKARIAEIERILSRPPLTEHRGQPVHGGQNSRFQLEEERQHLTVAVGELEAELARASSSLSVQTVEGKSTNAAAAPLNAVAEFGEVLAPGIGGRRRGWISAALGMNAVPAGNRREAFIKPILEKKGLSIRQWAINAKVDFHTADNYLKGMTKPYPDTLKKLADALGVKVEELPE